MTPRKLVLFIVFLPVILLLAVTQLPGLPGSAHARTDYRQLELFNNVRKMVRRNYVRDVDDKELFQGAINGMLQSLDPYSSYLTPEQLKELEDRTKRDFAGLGIEITRQNGLLTIVTPIDGTPADRAGLKADDKIFKIEGESAKNITPLEAERQIRGTKGTKIKLTILRKGFRRAEDFSIVREIIRPPSVKKQELAPGYLYLRIPYFKEGAAKEIKKILRAAGGEGSVKGLILDVRNNPGGMLGEAVDVSGLFVDDVVVTYTSGRTEDQEEEFRVDSGSIPYPDVRVAVLINVGSANQAEILAGALQDHDRALVFGSKSFGFASVQENERLPNGWGLRLTTAYYYTPKGRRIEETAIVPDVDLKEEIDKQEEKLHKEQRKSGEDKRKDPPVAPKDDLVVKQALKWLKSGLTVKKYKLEHQQGGAPASDTAWYDKE